MTLNPGQRNNKKRNMCTATGRHKMEWHNDTKRHNFSRQIAISAHLGYDSPRVHQLWATAKALLRLMPPLKNPIIIVCFRLGSLSTSYSSVFKNNYFSHLDGFVFFIRNFLDHPYFGVEIFHFDLRPSVKSCDDGQWLLC